MEKLKVRCRSCQKELIGQPGKVVTCGCANRTVIRGDVISAVDLSKVVMLTNPTKDKKNSLFTSDDLRYQESRRKRKVRKLDFEVR
tara:strand:+ start:139 stop:396 length:258 start_codon:yes stop_codon:yes gene_type:complete